MKNKKPFILVSLVIVIAIGIFAVFQMQKNKAEPAGDGVITIWCWDPNFNVPIMEEAAAIYNETNPDVKIEVVEMSQNDIVQKLDTILSSGTTEGLPDIVLIEELRAQRYLQTYPDAFVPLTDSFDYSQFTSFNAEAAKYNGEYYSMPFATGTSGMFVNTAVLEEAGYTLEDLENITWDEYFTIGEDVYNKTGVYWTSFDPKDLGPMDIMLQSAGTWYTDEDGNPNFVGNEAMQEGMEYIKTFATAPYVRPNTDWADYTSSLCSGDVVTTVSGVWLVGSIKACGEEMSGDWGVAPTPRLNLDGSVNASNLGGSSWFVLNTGDQEIAIDFLQTVFTGEDSIDFYNSILVNYGALCSYIPALQSEEMLNYEDEYFGGQKIYADFAEWQSTVPTVNYGKYSYEGRDAILQILPEYTSGELSTEEFLQKAEENFMRTIE